VKVPEISKRFFMRKPWGEQEAAVEEIEMCPAKVE